MAVNAYAHSRPTVAGERTRSSPVHSTFIQGFEVMQRANWFAVSPEGAKAVAALHQYVTTGTGLPERLVHLVFLRVSQINGCAHCIDIHTRDLLKAGMDIETIVLIPVWEEVAHLFSAQELSALAWTEEVTRVSETHASDEAYRAAAQAFSEKELVDLTLTIAAMNAINRMGVSFRMKPRARPGQPVRADSSA